MYIYVYLHVFIYIYVFIIYHMNLHFDRQIYIINFMCLHHILLVEFFSWINQRFHFKIRNSTVCQIKILVLFHFYLFNSLHVSILFLNLHVTIVFVLTFWPTLTTIFLIFYWYITKESFIQEVHNLYFFCLI